jgi:hypothetical protein
MKKPIGITIFGIINIVLGIIPTTFLIFESIRSSFFITVVFLFTFAGWVTDNEFVCFLDWFLQTIMERGSLIILYITSLFLFWSGITMIRRKSYSRKLSLFSMYLLFLSWLVFITSSIIDSYLYLKLIFDISAFWILLVITLGLLVYVLLFTRYSMNPKIKEYFNDANIKFPLKRIYLVVVIILIIIFIPILQYLHLFSHY